MVGLASAGRYLRHRSHAARVALRHELANVNHRVPEGTVALTFDDGPHPTSTGRVLDVLGELDVTATFFCVGRNASTHPEIVQRALLEGHAIGSHSQTHPPDSQRSLGTLTREYREGRRSVAHVLGREAGLFRPPYGHLSTKSALLIATQAVTTWLWTVDPADWRAGVSPEEVAAVAGQAQSGDVILLHDWVEQPWEPAARDRTATIAALPQIVRTLQEKGLQFVCLPT